MTECNAVFPSCCAAGRNYKSKLQMQQILNTKKKENVRRKQLWLTLYQQVIKTQILEYSKIKPLSQSNPDETVSSELFKLRSIKLCHKLKTSKRAMRGIT